jgi:pSer/pThr/pTyr-binding forkhead associated (FHA) protein
MIIGRTVDNDVQIESRFISRHHAQIVSDQTRSIVEDLNSTNGVFIRAQRLKHQTLVDGDIIQIGEHKLLYRDMRNVADELPPPEDDEEDLDEADDFDDDEDERDDEGDADDLDEDEEEEQERLNERDR